MLPLFPRTFRLRMVLPTRSLGRERISKACDLKRREKDDQLTTSGVINNYCVVIV